jgi:hypothetical protein
MDQTERIHHPLAIFYKTESQAEHLCSRTNLFAMEQYEGINDSRKALEAILKKLQNWQYR